MPAYNMGVLTSEAIDRERKDIDVATEIAELEPDGDEFITLLLRARKKTARTLKLEWFMDQPDAYFTRVSNASGYDVAAQEFRVLDATVFKAKDLALNTRTMEVYYVDQDPNYAGNTIHVQARPFITGATPLPLQDNDVLMKLSNAMEENSLAPKTSYTQPVMDYNYIQVVRTPFDQSMESAEEALAVGGKERSRLRRKFLFNHRFDLERTLLFGQRVYHVNLKLRALQGLVPFLSTNLVDLMGQDLTEDVWEKQICKPAFDYGSKSKLFLCSETFAGAINMIAQNKIETSSGETTYGIRLRKYRSYHGDIYIVTTKAFRGLFEDWGMMLDMKNILVRPYRNEDTRLRPDIQENDRLGWKDEYVTALSLQVNHEQTHLRVKGLKTA